MLDIEQVLGAVHRDGDGPQVAGTSPASDPASATRLAELSTRLSRCADLDTLVGATVDGLAELFGYEHSVLLLLDEEGTRLYTIASHGYPEQGVGSEIVVGEGIVGMAAARGTPIRLGNLRQMAKYSHAVRHAFEAGGEAGREIPVPTVPETQSRVAVPALALGQLVGVLVVESTMPVAFAEADEALLTVVASVVASAIEVERTHARVADSATTRERTKATTSPAGSPTHVRFFNADGSTFVDGDYLIKGVAGRLLWSLLAQHEEEGRTEFTNREVRLDSRLELPQFRDNFESRLILLKRRLEERDAPIQIEKTGRGRFRLVVGGALRLEAVGEPAD